MPFTPPYRPGSTGSPILAKSLFSGLLLAGALLTGNAHADDYSEVSGLLRSGQTSQAMTRAEQ